VVGTVSTLYAAIIVGIKPIVEVGAVSNLMAIRIGHITVLIAISSAAFN
jgi:hypothetical protein